MLDIGVIGEAPGRAAVAWGRRTALLFEGSRCSYQQLSQRVEALAAMLADLGIGGGDRVALHSENRPGYLIAYFAVPAASAILVPLNTFLAAAEVRGALEDSGAVALIASAGSLSRLGPILPELTHLRHLVICGEGPDPPVRRGRLTVSRFVDLPARNAPRQGREPCGSRAAPRSRPEQTAVIIYTSGTTGRPKGVMLSHRNLLANAAACIRAVGATPRDRILLPLPLFHSFTQMVGVLAPVLSGMKILLCRKLDRAAIRRIILWRRPTIFPAVPAVFAAMAHAPVGVLGRRLNPIRLYICGGAPLSLETLRVFEARYRRPLCEGYGLSEASPVVALNPPAGPRKPGSVGLPLPGVSVRVVDGSGQAVPAGQTGELVLQGPSVMQGYFRRPEQTRAVLRDGWLHTGDLARIDGKGYIFIMGRSKEMLIFRGMNIYPREIEQVLEAHPAVREAAVVGIRDARRGEVPHAFIVRHPRARVTAADLKRACLDSLARYKVPRAFTFLPELPRNAAGKVLKGVLKDRVAAQPSGGAVAG